MPLLKTFAAALLALAATVLVLRTLNPLPPLEPRQASRALTEAGRTPLGRGVQRLTAAHPGLDGLRMLDDGRVAFAARVLLARAAARSLDVQYYIWHGDLSGSLLLHEMRLAADRGVRVRMLLDDNGTRGLDAALAALDRHPGIEVRLFNPFVIRNPKAIGYLLDFARLNRRLHNKSFTADNQATIVGGRNVGGEYFGARDDGLFANLDVLAIGPVVEDVSADFDRYWNSASAYPAERILPAVEPERIAEIAEAAAASARAPAARDYLEAIRTLPFVARVEAGAMEFEWAPARMVSDDPAKALGEAEPHELLSHALAGVLGAPRREVALVSGYFVPTTASVEAFADLAGRGVEVSILTNSWTATDVAVVHAGYAGRRKALLEAGVRLYEMRGGSDGASAPDRLLLIGSGGGSPGSVGPLSPRATTLHAKTFAVDRRRMFVGSFNFDPRSIHLNTELGFVIESPAFATALARSFTDRIPARAYEVRLASDGALVWIERTGGGTVRHDVEPETTRLQRWSFALLSRLPIEWLL